MELTHIKRLYKAMAENGFSELELEINQTDKCVLKLGSALSAPSAEPKAIGPKAPKEPKNTDIQIRSTKVGSFIRAKRELRVGDKVSKGEVLGYIEGITGIKGREPVAASANGVISVIEADEASVIDYNKLLFVLKPE